MNISIKAGTLPFPLNPSRHPPFVTNSSQIRSDLDIMAAPAADWSQAPADILWNIIKRLPLADYIRFGGVCVPWRSTLAQKRCGPAPQVPWLILPGDGNGANDGTVRLFSLTEKKDYRISLPEIRKFRCIGSSEGFLIYTDWYSELHMLDPISGAHVDLPSITTLPDIVSVGRDSKGRINRYFVSDPLEGEGGTQPIRANFRFSYFRKAILSPGSTLESYTVVAISCYGSEKIAFARAGDKAWSTIHIHDGFFGDVIFHNQLLVALSPPNAVTINLNRPSAPILSLEGKEGFAAPEDRRVDGYCQLYLVVLSGSGSGELLLVSRYARSPDPTDLINYETFKVSLHKLDSSRQKWVVAKSIGDHALFLGHGHSVSLSTLDFPEIKPNCIYFTDNYLHYSRHVPFDMGVYDMEGRTMKPYYPPDSVLNWPPPIWFTTNMKNLTGNY